ncbi:taurine ABC transporter ATP-binding subunit, partial [Klebsiella pneumoniae]
LLATELVLLSPRPGRVVHRIRPTFAQRFLAGESIRAIKADPAFLALREELALAILTSEEEAESHA